MQKRRGNAGDITDVVCNIVPFADVEHIVSNVRCQFEAGLDTLHEKAWSQIQLLQGSLFA